MAVNISGTWSLYSAWSGQIEDANLIKLQKDRRPFLFWSESWRQLVLSCQNLRNTVLGSNSGTTGALGEGKGQEWYQIREVSLFTAFFGKFEPEG